MWDAGGVKLAWEAKMAMEPLHARPGTAEKTGDPLGIWQVAPAQSARTMSDHRLRVQSRVRHDFTAVPDPIDPGAARGDCDPVSPLSGCWPRVFPGL
jgi:hypothetical protein